MSDDNSENNNWSFEHEYDESFSLNNEQETNNSLVSNNEQEVNNALFSDQIKDYYAAYLVLLNNNVDNDSVNTNGYSPSEIDHQELQNFLDILDVDTDSNTNTFCNCLCN